MRKINIILLLLIISAAFLILRNLFSYAFIFLDDSNLLCKSIKEILLFPNCGQYISSILGRLFAALIPLWEGVHPCYFRGFYFSYIKSAILIGYALLLTNIIFINKKINYLYPLSFLFVISLLFYIIQQQLHLLLFVYEGFFRMLLPPFIFAGLLYLMVKNIRNNEAKNVVPVFLLTFLCSISNESVCIMTVFGFLLYFLFSVKSSKRNLLIFACLLISLTGCFILVKTGAFIRKTENIIIDSQYILTVLKDIPYFTKDYLKYIFFKHIFEYILIAGMILILHFRYKDNEVVNKNIIKLICSFLMGILIFFYMLIGLGQTHYSGGYWLSHSDLHVILDIVLCSFIFVLLNLLIEYKFLKEYILGVFFVITSLFLLISNYKVYTPCITVDIIPIRTEIYKAEKIIRLANIHNKPAVLNKELYESIFYWSLWYSFDDKEENVLYPSSRYIDYLNQFEKEENKLINGVIFSDEETVNKEFALNAGSFTEEELKEPNFNNLLNKDFILDGGEKK